MRTIAPYPKLFVNQSVAGAGLLALSRFFTDFDRLTPRSAATPDIAIKSLRPASLRTGVPENRHFLLLSPTNSTTYKRGSTQHGSFWQIEIAS